MASLRQLVAGSDMCTPGDAGAGPSNAVGALVNTLLGTVAKTQEQLREARSPPALSLSRAPARPPGRRGVGGRPLAGGPAAGAAAPSAALTRALPHHRHRPAARSCPSLPAARAPRRRRR